MSMEGTIGKKFSRSQLEELTTFLEKYPQLVKGVVGSEFEKTYKYGLWQDLANILNSEEAGAKKSVMKWRKSLKDYKSYVKKKYLSYLADPYSNSCRTLSYLDVRMLALMGYVVDIGGMENSDSEVQTFILEEIQGNVDEDAIHSTGYKEQSQRFYQAPQIITLQPKDEPDSSPKDDSEITSNKEKSENVGETSCNKETSNKELTQDNEETLNKELEQDNEESVYNVESRCNEESPSYNVEFPCNEESSDNEDAPYNVETLCNEESISNVEDLLNEESSCDEELPYIEKSPAKKSLGKKRKYKKQTSNTKKKRNSKNATATALQAIAQELSAKNEIAKMKIELEKEKLILEKRKIEAFELIAKRLYRKK